MSIAPEEFRSSVTVAVPGPDGPRRTRILAGFLSADEAVRMIQGGRPGLAEEPGLRARLEELRMAVAARPAFEPADPVLPAEPGVRPDLSTLADRADIRAGVGNRPCRVAWVDLRRVVAVQKGVITSGLGERVSAAARDPAALLELCLPSGPDNADISFNLDPDRHGLTLVSSHANLRFTGIGRQSSGIVVGFTVPPAHVHIARYRDRWFLRNGHHRLAGLLRAGVTVVPALLTEADTFEHLALGGGAFTEQVAHWPAPPLLTDFWDDTVALDADRPVFRTGFHIRADEIRLPL